MSAVSAPLPAEECYIPLSSVRRILGAGQRSREEVPLQAKHQPAGWLQHVPAAAAGGATHRRRRRRQKPSCSDTAGARTFSWVLAEERRVERRNIGVQEVGSCKTTRASILQAAAFFRESVWTSLGWKCGSAKLPLVT